MRYLLIDRIERVELGRAITARKNVALSEDIFSDHFPGYPVMPGALLIEALAQAGTALLEITHEYRRKALLVMVEQAKFRSFARPGDVLTVRGELVSSDDVSARFAARIDEGERRVADATLTFVLQEIDRFYPARFRSMLDGLYRTWLEGADIVGASEATA